MLTRLVILPALQLPKITMRLPSPPNLLQLLLQRALCILVWGILDSPHTLDFNQARQLNGKLLPLIAFSLYTASSSSLFFQLIASFYRCFILRHHHQIHVVGILPTYTPTCQCRFCMSFLGFNSPPSRSLGLSIHFLKLSLSTFSEVSIDLMCLKYQ